MNLELGFKRVAWVISGFGLIVSVIALVCVIFDADQKAAFGFGILGGVGWFCLSGWFSLQSGGLSGDSKEKNN